MKHRVLDCNYICHAARFAGVGALNNGVIYSFFNTLLNLGEANSTNRFLFAWDSRKSYRKIIFPEYKKKRHKNLTVQEREELEAAFEQMNRLRNEILPRLGFKNVLHQNGCEGDDLIAELVMHGGRENDDFLIVATDHDLYQLLREGVVILAKKNKYALEDFTAEFGISPAQWVEVKKIGGCTSDEVPGVHKVGEKTVCKYLRGELKETAKAYQAIVSEEGRAIAERNDILVRLPHPRTKPIEIADDEPDLHQFKLLCRELKFKHFLEERWDEWRRFFRGYRRVTKIEDAE